LHKNDHDKELIPDTAEITQTQEAVIGDLLPAASVNPTTQSDASEAEDDTIYIDQEGTLHVKQSDEGSTPKAI
jgi:hypothetical protein